MSAWEFEAELEIANCFVEARTEIEFFDSVCSVQSNLPVPKQNEVYYWEAKLYDKPENTLVSIGMTTKPYPMFRLPGRSPSYPEEMRMNTYYISLEEEGPNSNITTQAGTNTQSLTHPLANAATTNPFTVPPTRPPSTKVTSSASATAPAPAPFSLRAMAKNSTTPRTALNH